MKKQAFPFGLVNFWLACRALPSKRSGAVRMDCSPIRRQQQQHGSEEAVQGRPHLPGSSLYSEVQDGDPSLICQAASVLSEPNPQCKADQTRILAQLWNDRQLAAGKQAVQLPERPCRDDSRVSNLHENVVCAAQLTALDYHLRTQHLSRYDFR